MSKSESQFLNVVCSKKFLIKREREQNLDGTKYFPTLLKLSHAAAASFQKFPRSSNHTKTRALLAQIETFIQFQGSSAVCGESKLVVRCICFVFEGRTFHV
jgi:hypothetical protein